MLCAVLFGLVAARAKQCKLSLPLQPGARAARMLLSVRVMAAREREVRRICPPPSP